MSLKIKFLLVLVGVCYFTNAASVNLVSEGSTLTSNQLEAELQHSSELPSQTINVYQQEENGPSRSYLDHAVDLLEEERAKVTSGDRYKRGATAEPEVHESFIRTCIRVFYKCRAEGNSFLKCLIRKKICAFKLLTGGSVEL